MENLNNLPVTDVKKTSAELPATISAPLSPFGSIAEFETAQRMAKALAASTFVPKEFQNNIGDCLVLLETASRTNMPIMALMQNMYIVYGKPSFSSAFMTGLINSSGRFKSPLQFEYNKERTSCYAHATNHDGQIYRGITVTMAMANAEGWTNKKGSKWKTMPELMLQYRAASFFAKAYCADIIMGMRDQYEVEDSAPDNSLESGVGEALNTVIVTQTDEQQNETIDASPQSENSDIVENNELPTKDDNFIQDCPNGHGRVAKSFCDTECQTRPGCPEHPSEIKSSGSKLNINL